MPARSSSSARERVSPGSAVTDQGAAHLIHSALHAVQGLQARQRAGAQLNAPILRTRRAPQPAAVSESPARTSRSERPNPVKDALGGAHQRQVQHAAKDFARARDDDLCAPAPRVSA